MAKRHCRLLGIIKQTLLESDSRRVIGWSMDVRMQTSLVLDALLMAVWRRKASGKVIVHSDQGSQFTSQEGQSFLKVHNLEASMSRRGNCYDNAVAESFSTCSKQSRLDRKPMKLGYWHVKTYLIILKCFIIGNENMVIMGCCHPKSLK